MTDGKTEGRKVDGPPITSGNLPSFRRSVSSRSEEELQRPTPRLPPRRLDPHHAALREIDPHPRGASGEEQRGEAAHPRLVSHQRDGLARLDPSDPDRDLGQGGGGPAAPPRGHPPPPPTAGVPPAARGGRQ